MDINNLIDNIKTKLLKNSFIENVIIEDKTYIHLKHSSHDKNNICQKQNTVLFLGKRSLNCIKIRSYYNK